MRLERLGLQRGQVETPPVPGTDDQIDVEFAVEGSPRNVSGTLATPGYGLILGANYQQSNLQNSLSVGLNYSQYQQSVNFITSIRISRWLASVVAITYFPPP